MASSADLLGSAISNAARLAGLSHPAPEAGRPESNIALPAGSLGCLHTTRHEKAGIAPQTVDLPSSHPAQKDVRPCQAIVAPKQVQTFVRQGQVLVHPVDQVFRALIQCVRGLQRLVGIIALENNL